MSGMVWRVSLATSHRVSILAWHEGESRSNRAPDCGILLEVDPMECGHARSQKASTSSAESRVRWEL